MTSLRNAFAPSCQAHHAGPNCRKQCVDRVYVGKDQSRTSAILSVYSCPSRHTAHTPPRRLPPGEHDGDGHYEIMSFSNLRARHSAYVYKSNRSRSKRRRRSSTHAASPYALIPSSSRYCNHVQPPEIHAIQPNHILILCIHSLCIQVVSIYIPAPGMGPVTPSGARLPSIRRFASCFSSVVGLSLRISGMWGALLGLCPMDMPTRT